MLRELNRRYSLLWMCFGDFNEILTMGEKMGGGGGSLNTTEKMYIRRKKKLDIKA